MKSTIFTSSLHAFDETSLFDINKTHAFRQIAFFQFSSSSVIDTCLKFKINIIFKFM